MVQASAERLPFEANSFDAAMAIQTVHHWPDAQTGLDEMVRVARKRVLVVAFDPDLLHDLWISADYFRGIIDLKDRPKADSKEFARMLPGSKTLPIPVARDCRDLFFAALWARPELFLEDEIVNPMWVWQSIPVDARDQGRRRLAEELESGEWDLKYGHLRRRDELDVGLRLIVLESVSSSPTVGADTDQAVSTDFVMEPGD